MVFMGVGEMFEFLNKGGEEKAQLAAENRAMNFNRESNTFNAVTNPNQDQTDIAYQESKTDLIKWQQDLDPELEKIAFQLTGWVKKNNTWIKTDKKPLCNDRFMDDVIIPQCAPYLSRIMTNTNLQEERILKMLECTANTIADNMSDNFDIYGIESVNNDIVLNEIENFCITSAFRSVDGWTKKMDSSMIKRIESSIDHIPQQDNKKSLFSW